MSTEQIAYIVSNCCGSFSIIFGILFCAFGICAIMNFCDDPNGSKAKTFIKWFIVSVVFLALFIIVGYTAESFIKS